MSASSKIQVCSVTDSLPGNAGAKSRGCGPGLSGVGRNPAKKAWWAAYVKLPGQCRSSQAPPGKTRASSEHVYFPLLRRMGATPSAELQRSGFYPAGGGAFHVTLTAPPALTSLELVEREANPSLEAWALSSRLPSHVAARELAVVREQLDLPARLCRPRPVNSPGPGNVLCVLVGRDTPELVTAFGEVGRRAEEVAQDAVDQTRRYLDSGVPVGVHLADQLVLLLALTGGRFRTSSLSSHAHTNIQVVRSFLGDRAMTVEDGPTRATVTVSCRGLRG